MRPALFRAGRKNERRRPPVPLSVPRVTILLAALALSFCAPQPADPPAPAAPQRWRGLSVESRSLRADGTLAAVGLKPEAERDDGAAGWDYRFSDRLGSGDSESVDREFTIVVANRRASAIELHARLEFHDPSKGMVLRREWERMVVPPFTENRYEGVLRLPRPGTAEPLLQILPQFEPFDP